MLQKLFIVFFAHPASFMNFRDHDARIDGIDPDALRGKLECRTARQLVDSGLGYAVSEDAGKGTQAGDTRDVDDVAFGFDQVRSGNLHQLKYGAQGDVHHCIPGGERSVFDRTCGDVSGRIYQYVQAAKSVSRLVDRALAL